MLFGYLLVSSHQASGKCNGLTSQQNSGSCNRIESDVQKISCPEDQISGYQILSIVQLSKIHTLMQRQSQVVSTVCGLDIKFCRFLT